MTETLAVRVKMSCMNTVGADEHLQIANLIREARVHLVDGEAALAARSALIDHTHSLEKNLDLVKLPSSPTWFEWPLPPRNGRPHSSTGRERTGILVTPHPVDPNLHMVISAWEIDDVAMHAYGIAIIAQADLDELAQRARGRFRSIAKDSIDRIMSVIVAFVPQAFYEEMRIISDGEDQSMAALRDGTADVPMLLALLLLTASEGGAISTVNGDAIDVTMGERYSMSTILRLSETIFRRPKQGFRRLNEGSAAWLDA
jgi:hypothetical protein